MNFPKNYVQFKKGFSKPMTTPNKTLIWVTNKKASQIVKDQIDCMGCLSQ